MKLSSLGEFGLIDLIKDAVRPTHQPSSDASSRVIVDIGDDTAAWSGSELVQLATTDCLVEDVHFRFRWCSWEDLGHKSLAVNLSDVAAMGGFARYALVSLSCPGDVDSESILEYYRGMTRLAMQHGVVVIGGNLTSSPLVISTVCVTGEALPGRLLTRDAARPGDVVAVRGQVGGAAAALALLDEGNRTPGLVSADLLRFLVRPEPRLPEGRILAEEGVRCAIDISDGLLSDLTHICESSDVSAVVQSDRLPVCAAFEGSAGDGMRFALAGGEDYELLFTCKPALLPRLASTLPCPVSAIGEITPHTGAHRVVVLGQDGLPLDAGRTGWRHFES